MPHARNTDLFTDKTAGSYMNYKIRTMERRNKMKIWALSLAVISSSLILNTAALAADDQNSSIYNKNDYSVSDQDASSYKTVLIENSKKIPVYIDQADGDSFGAAAKFFLKENPESGMYTINYGDESGYRESKTFAVDVDPVNISTKMDQISDKGISKNEDGSYNVGFTALVSNEIRYKSVILKQNLDGTYMGYDIPDLPVISGEGSTELGVQINNIPENIFDSGVKVYLSTKSVEEYGTADPDDNAGGISNE